MSYWTNIYGTITVSPIGRTQPEMKYILDTVLDHLPKVTGSEEDMKVYTVQKYGSSILDSCNEFGEDVAGGHFELQDEYMIIINSSLRDRKFKDTYQEFQKWLCRLSKRLLVVNVLVEISDYEKHKIIDNKNDVYGCMYELPSWTGSEDEEVEPAWYEYLMWDKCKNSDYPIMLAYKYCRDKENDKEAKRRIKYERD